jgi:hypothetical protein
MGLLTRALASARVARQLSTKVQTKLVGLEVVPDALPALSALCAQQLEAVKVLPPSIPYRKDLEKFSNFLLGAIGESKSISDFEAKAGLGEVEEVIEMVQTELTLIPKYAEWRAWEEPTGAEKARLDLNKTLILESLKDRGTAIRRLDIPMADQSVDFPTAINPVLKQYVPPPPPEPK